MELANIIKADYCVYKEHLCLDNFSLLKKIFYLIYRSTFVVVFLFRLSGSEYYLIRKITVPMYKIARILSGIQIRRGTVIGPGLLIPHYGAIVVNFKAKIGDKCVIMHNVTIGAKGRGDDVGVPEIGNNVYIGAGATLIGSISIGNNCTIGAGSVVTKHMLDNSTVVGNPAREL